MPFPRFYKLAPEKRERLMQAAAQEFAHYGFEHASINRILEQIQMSKGAAYYYFEDKVDLFCTVVQYAHDHLQLIDQQQDIAELSAESFWPTFADLHRLPLLRSFEQPWLFATLGVAGRLPPATLEHEPLATLGKQLMKWVMDILKQGQALKVVRTDIADELLIAWLQALDEASDQWLLTHWQELDREAIARISDQTVEAMRCALAPPSFV